jgi:probable rRNA maturation factor
VEINILIEEGIEVATNTAWVQDIAERTLKAENVPFSAEMGLVITGQKQIQELNRDYRGLDYPTDVLSFSMSEQKVGEVRAFIGPPDGLLHLGEVIISYPQAVIQAKERGHTIKKELAILIVHGVLHLLGYDHEKPEMEPAMTAREQSILSSLAREIT